MNLKLDVEKCYYIWREGYKDTYLSSFITMHTNTLFTLQPETFALQEKTN